MNGEYRIMGDMHTHTVASQHAYATVKELIDRSKELGMEFISITDHGPEMLDGANRMHFLCLKNLPKIANGIRLYKGAEVNIKSFDGRLDLDNSILKTLDFVIASYHMEALEPGSEEENTRGWLSVIGKKHVDCLGHAGNPKFPFNHEAVVKALKERGKILEINAHSPVARKGCEENCLNLIRLCKKYEVAVVATSDAHNTWSLGNVDLALKMLEEMDFPPRLILNSSTELMDEFIERRKKEKNDQSS